MEPRAAISNSTRVWWRSAASVAACASPPAVGEFTPSATKGRSRLWRGPRSTWWAARPAPRSACKTQLSSPTVDISAGSSARSGCLGRRRIRFRRFQRTSISVRPVRRIAEVAMVEPGKGICLAASTGGTVAPRLAEGGWASGVRSCPGASGGLAGVRRTGQAEPAWRAQSRCGDGGRNRRSCCE